jgi:hypothetical protein
MNLIVLLISILMLVVLSIVISNKIKSHIFSLAIFLFYFWTLHGAWFIIFGVQSDSIEHLNNSLFTLKVDETYLYTITLYSLFLIIISLTFYFLASKNNCQNLIYKINNNKLILYICFFGVLGFALALPAIEAAISNGLAVYLVSRGAEDIYSISSFYTIQQISLRIATTLSFFGASIYFSGKSGKYIVVNDYRKIYLYFLACISLTLLHTFLGNKNEILFALISAVLFYFYNAKNPRVFYIIITSIIGLYLFGAINIVRASPSIEYFEILKNLDFFDLISIPFGLFGPNMSEPFAAHFSLYGIILLDMPLTLGSSFVYLINSIIPSVFEVARPPDIYSIYISSMQSTSQGFTIHHAAGWYLNFGISGVIMGAFLFGAIFAFLFNRSQKINNKKKYINILNLLLPLMFVAYIPSLVRAGPEIYKGIFVELLLTILILSFSLKQFNKI